MFIILWFLATEIRIFRRWRAKQRNLRRSRELCESPSSEIPLRTVSRAMKQRGSAREIMIADR